MTDTATPNVVSRVRKLLALGNNAAATEGERDNALRMAYATMAKYNIAATDVKDAEHGIANEPRERQSTTFSVYPWARAIAHTLAGMFFCEYFYQRGYKGKQAEHFFVGKQSNAITANEMAVYVVNSVFKELRQRYGTDTSPEARSFATGVADKLRTRVYELRSAAERESAQEARKAAADALALGHTPGTALVLAAHYEQERKLNREWIEQHEGPLKTTTDRTKQEIKGSAYAAGKDYGAKVSLHRQVGTATNSKVKRLK
jgi:hypothetical protein